MKFELKFKTIISAEDEDETEKIVTIETKGPIDDSFFYELIDILKELPNPRMQIAETLYSMAVRGLFDKDHGSKIEEDLRSLFDEFVTAGLKYKNAIEKFENNMIPAVNQEK